MGRLVSHPSVDIEAAGRGGLGLGVPLAELERVAATVLADIELVVDALHHAGGVSPTAGEVARDLAVDPEAVVDALFAPPPGSRAPVYSERTLLDLHFAHGYSRCEIAGLLAVSQLRVAGALRAALARRRRLRILA